MTDLPDDITRRLPEEDRIRERIRERREAEGTDEPDDDAVSGTFKFGDDLGVKTGDITGDLGDTDAVKTGDITGDPDAILTTNENITALKADAVIDDIATIDQKVVDHKADDLKVVDHKADDLTSDASSTIDSTTDSVKTADGPSGGEVDSVKGGVVMINVTEDQPSDLVGDALAPLDDISGGDGVLVGDEVIVEVDDAGLGLDDA